MTGARPQWNAQLRSECQDSCAEFGDPACWAFATNLKDGVLLAEDTGEPLNPCDDCLRACGFEVPEPIDPAAVVEPLL